MEELIIGLGSNLGDRRGNIERAIDLIGKQIGKVKAISALIETEPWGFKSDNRFLNCAIIVDEYPSSVRVYPAGAGDIIGILQSIEQGFGRIRTGVYADRAIDLDILFYGDQVINEPELIIPHPKLHEREFILVSLMEICPDKIHPLIGKTIREIWDQKHFKR